MSEQPDLENMPLEELAALANAEAPPTEEVFEVADPAAPVAQPRNADGTFASISPAPVVEPAIEVPVIPEPTSFSRTIDLGDGSGAQVFTAATKDELLDKLADAQKHATRKIRELNQVAKQVPKAPVKKELTADEEYLLGQRLINEPSKAVRELLEAELGMPFEEFKASTAQARQITQERVNKTIATQWLKATPNYHETEANNRRIDSYIARILGGEFSADNLSVAYKDLSESGLLEVKPATPPPAPPAAPAPPRARASSLSSRISTIAAPPKGHTVDDMYKMSMDELAEHANRS